MTGSSGDTHPASDQPGTQDDGGFYWLASKNCVILVRQWKHGEQTGFTAKRIFMHVDEHEGTCEMTQNDEWAVATSENIAKWLATGTFRKIAGPIPQSPFSE